MCRYYQVDVVSIERSSGGSVRASKLLWTSRSPNPGGLTSIGEVPPLKGSVVPSAVSNDDAVMTAII